MQNQIDLTVKRLATHRQPGERGLGKGRRCCLPEATKAEVDMADTVCCPPGSNERELLTAMLQEVTITKPRAWENREGNHLCPESMAAFPRTKTGHFSIPGSLMKESYIFKSYLRDLPFVGIRRW